MAGNDKPPIRRDVGRSAKTQSDRPVDRPFDMWLHKQLHAMYDEIASEPLPDELIDLIEHDAKKKDSPPDSSGS